MAHTRAHLPSFESSKTLNHTDCHAASVPAASPGGDAGSAGGAAGALAANPPIFFSRVSVVVYDIVYDNHTDA